MICLVSILLLLLVSPRPSIPFQSILLPYLPHLLIIIYIYSPFSTSPPGYRDFIYACRSLTLSFLSRGPAVCCYAPPRRSRCICLCQWTCWIAWASWWCGALVNLGQQSEKSQLWLDWCFWDLTRHLIVRGRIWLFLEHRNAASKICRGTRRPPGKKAHWS